jgi:hypothetical protein
MQTQKLQICPKLILRDAPFWFIKGTQQKETPEYLVHLLSLLQSWKFVHPSVACLWGHLSKNLVLSQLSRNRCSWLRFGWASVDLWWAKPPVVWIPSTLLCQRVGRLNLRPKRWPPWFWADYCAVWPGEWGGGRGQGEGWEGWEGIIKLD